MLHHAQNAHRGTAKCGAMASACGSGALKNVSQLLNLSHVDCIERFLARVARKDMESCGVMVTAIG